MLYNRDDRYGQVLMDADRMISFSLCGYMMPADMSSSGSIPAAVPSQTYKHIVFRAPHHKKYAFSFHPDIIKEKFVCWPGFRDVIDEFKCVNGIAESEETD